MVFIGLRVSFLVVHSQFLFWSFPVAGDIFQFPHLFSIIIPIVENFYEVSVLCKFITIIFIFPHEFPFLLEELLHLRMFLGVVIVIYKDVTQEVHFIDKSYLSTLSDFFTTDNHILCIGIDIIGIRL